MSPFELTDERPLVLRASPRLLAPDWADKLRHAPPGAFLLTVVILAVGVLRPGTASSWLVAVAVVAILFAGPYFAKLANSEVRIGRTYVESRDALRRSIRVDRDSLVSMTLNRQDVFSSRFGLTKVVIADREGRPRLRLAWDSYSDSDLDRIRETLDLQPPRGCSR